MLVVPLRSNDVTPTIPNIIDIIDTPSSTLYLREARYRENTAIARE